MASEATSDPHHVSSQEDRRTQQERVADLAEIIRSEGLPNDLRRDLLALIQDHNAPSTESGQRRDPGTLEDLVREIRTGRAVAFVGAGFSRNFAPGWGELLDSLKGPIADTSRGRQVEKLLSGRPSTREFEAAAQLIREAYDQDEHLHFAESLSEAFKPLDVPSDPNGGDAPDPTDDDRGRLDQRIKWLEGIPFRAVLTTNFDGYLSDGQSPGPTAYAQVLRRDAAWWDAEVNPLSGLHARRPVVELHGNARDDIAATDRSVVFTREQYLKRVHGEPGYREFLKALLMTSTVVFLGFSFNDAYINGLRADVQAMFGSGDGQEPLAWAVMDDVDDELANYLRRHERIGVIQIGSDVAGDFDWVLEQLYERTNALRRVRDLLKDKRVVWIDSRPKNNEYGRDVLAGDADEAREHIVTINPNRGDHWVDQLLAAPAPDLIITHWGRGQGDSGEPRGLEVLRTLRTRDDLPSAPVIVFAAGGHEYVGTNRLAALEHGATSFETEWSGLFREISRLFDDVDRGGLQPKPVAFRRSSDGRRSA